MKLESGRAEVAEFRSNVLLALKTMILPLYYAESCFFLRNNIFYVILTSVWVLLRKICASH